MRTTEFGDRLVGLAREFSERRGVSQREGLD